MFLNEYTHYFSEGSYEQNKTRLSIIIVVFSWILKCVRYRDVTAYISKNSQWFPMIKVFFPSHLGSMQSFRMRVAQSRGSAMSWDFILQ